MILICACCGGEAPARHQWYNRDKGYGVCERCFLDAVKAEGIEQAISHYGAPGIHHSLKPRPELKTVQRLKSAESQQPVSNLGDNAPACPECSATGQHYQTCSFDVDPGL